MDGAGMSSHYVQLKQRTRVRVRACSAKGCVPDALSPMVMVVAAFWVYRYVVHTNVYIVYTIRVCAEPEVEPEVLHGQQKRAKK